MRAVHCVLIASALLAALPAFAQQSRIEDRLSADEFRAAGLDKLSDAELARLNELLERNAAPAQVAASDAAGMPAAPRSREPVESTLPGPFAGLGRGREYTLANGQVWKQIDGATIAGARGNDVGVRIRRGLVGVWWMKVDGYNTEAKVERVR